MAELQNPQEEQFAKLLSVGVDQSVAYGKAGWKPDKANASKRARAPNIIERVAELRAEEAARVAKLRMEAGDLPGADELKRALQGAASAGQWAAVVSGAKALAEMDGSGQQLNPERQLSDTDILRIANGLGPVHALAARMILTFDSFDRPDVPDTDIELAVVGLANWFTPQQLKDLGARLARR